MVIRTYFWHARVMSGPRRTLHRVRSRGRAKPFRSGNAGDVFTRDVLASRYGLPVQNVEDGGRRLLCVGSIADRIDTGDLVCGIGVKHRTSPPSGVALAGIVGLRGPITLEQFERSGYDTSGVRFLLDPGLLMRFMAPDGIDAIPGRAIFVPHYRERSHYRLPWRYPPNLDVVDVDAEPLELARRILSASVVFTSSLHGLIFAHALERPSVLVAPQTDEPLLKYEDYHASVGLPFRRPPRDIFEAVRGPTPDSAVTIRYGESDFHFPAETDLRRAGIITGS